MVVCEPKIGNELPADVPKSDGLGASCEPAVELLAPKMLVVVADEAVVSAGLVWLPKPPKKEVEVAAAGAAVAVVVEPPKRLGTVELVVTAGVVALLAADAPPKNDRDGVLWKPTLGAGWLAVVKLNLAAGGSAGLAGSAGLLPNENGSAEVEGVVGA